LVSLLIPLLQKTSRASISPARLILTSSAGHTGAPSCGVDYKSVVRDSDSSGRNEYNKWTEYFQSKWGNVAIARWVHWVHGPDEGWRKAGVVEKKSDGEIISISVHPG
jgi:hypothetical protein